MILIPIEFVLESYSSSELTRIWCFRYFRKTRSSSQKFLVVKDLKNVTLQFLKFYPSKSANKIFPHME